MFIAWFDWHLLSERIPKAQKESDDLTVFLHFWDLLGRKSFS
jgi:hypothetical protein